MRTAFTAALVCIASWIGLQVGAGNVGLQRAVAIGPLTLLEVPLALALAAALALVTAWLPGRLDRAKAPSPIRVLVGVLVGDAIGAVVLAPVLVGELEVIHAPVVFVAVTALGLQPLTAFLGAWLSRTRATRA
jgi:hypothetical protein